MRNIKFEKKIIYIKHMIFINIFIDDDTYKCLKVFKKFYTFYLSSNYINYNVILFCHFYATINNFNDCCTYIQYWNLFVIDLIIFCVMYKIFQLIC